MNHRIVPSLRRFYCHIPFLIILAAIMTAVIVGCDNDGGRTPDARLGDSIPGDTTVTPGDTTVTPGDTTVTPGDTTETPADTTADSSKLTVVLEAGDAPGTCDSCQKIKEPPPINIMGEFKKDGDVDCYCFEGKKADTYVIGVTGNNRKLDVDGKPGIDGLIVYGPTKDGPVCICVSGGKLGAYVITIFKS